MAEIKDPAAFDTRFWIQKLEEQNPSPRPLKPGPTIKYAAGSAAQTPYDLMDIFVRKPTEMIGKKIAEVTGQPAPPADALPMLPGEEKIRGFTERNRKASGMGPKTQLAVDMFTPGPGEFKAAVTPVATSLAATLPRLARADVLPRAADAVEQFFRGAKRRIDKGEIGVLEELQMRGVDGIEVDALLDFFGYAGRKGDKLIPQAIDEDKLIEVLDKVGEEFTGESLTALAHRQGLNREALSEMSADALAELVKKNSKDGSLPPDLLDDFVRTATDSKGQLGFLEWQDMDEVSGAIKELIRERLAELKKAYK